MQGDPPQAPASHRRKTTPPGGCPAEERSRRGSCLATEAAMVGLWLRQLLYLLDTHSGRQSLPWWSRRWNTQTRHDAHLTSVHMFASGSDPIWQPPDLPRHLIPNRTLRNTALPTRPPEACLYCSRRGLQEGPSTRRNTYDTNVQWTSAGSSVPSLIPCGSPT